MTATTSPITLMMAVDKPQYKTFTKNNVDQIESTQIRPNTFWSSKTDHLSSIRDLHEWLLNHLKQPNATHYAVMRGQWLPDADLWKMEERRKAELEAAPDAPAHLITPIIYRENGTNKTPRKLRRKALLTEQPLHWICFDFDGVEVEGVEFTVENPWPAVEAAIASELGEEFVGREFILQLSSSAGIKPGVRAHCWFWLKEPFTGAHWKAWFKQRAKVLGRDPFVDKAMFGVERIHFIAPPTFKPADLDPLKGGERWLFYDGLDDIVRLPVPEISEEREKGDYFNGAEMDAEEAQDAWSRPGIVGIFNRCYSMSETIQTFLDGIFTIDTPEGRVSWLESGAAPGGCKIFAGNTKMFSMHNSDPFGNEPRNAFDHIQEYLFEGDFAAAANWAETLDRCVAEKARAVSEEFDDVVEPPAEFVAKIDPTLVVEKKTPVLTPEKVMELYPMPKKWDRSEALYKLTPGGWRYGFMKEDPETEKKTFVELWSPITIWNRDISIQNNATTLQLKIMNHKGEPLDLFINRGETMSRTILGVLWEAGWNATSKKGDYFVEFLREQGNLVKNTRLVSSKRGWFQVTNSEGQGCRAFAAPSGRVYGADNVATEKIALRSDWVLQNARAGTLEGWQKAVRDLCAVENVPHWIIGVASGFVGPLMELFEGNTSGIVFGGDTSRGKTTALCWAASAWSSPDERKGGMMKSLRTTANAVENLAVGANGTALLLDETNLIDGKLLEGVVYTVAAGNGKQRLRVDGTARDTSNWSTFVLMSGESGIAQRFEQASGKKMGKGAAVRLLDFDISNVNAEVPIDTIRYLRGLIFANYGWAGEAFVERLIAEGLADDTRELWMMRRAALEKLAGQNAVGVTARAAELLSTLSVAVELALRWGLLPNVFRVRFEEAAAELWRQVVGGAVFNSHNDLLNQVQMWVNTKWDRSIVEIGNEKGVRDVEGWYNEEFIFLPPEKLLDATGGTVREAEIKKALSDFDCLTAFKNGDRIRHVYRHIPGIGPMNHYRLNRKMFRDLRDPGQDLKPEDVF